MRALLPLVLVVVACGSDPASIAVPPTTPIYDRAMITLDAQVLDGDGEALDLAVTPVKVSDPDTLLLGKNGELQCARYGDVTVTLQAGEEGGPTVTTDTLVRCQLVKEIAVEPAKVAFTLREDEAGALRPQTSEPLRITVVGLDGQPVPDADVSVTSSDPSIARVEGGAVQARQMGAATIKVAAGDKVTEVPVEAAQVVEERLGMVVEDGEKHGIPVEAGRYRVTVGSDQPVEVSVQGADCSGDGAQTAHAMTCELDKAGTVQLDNPAIFGLGGGKATVNLRVLRTP